MLKATNGTDTIYYTKGFELISRREGDAASFYLYDGGLSVRALTDEAGAITDTLVFDAFGIETEKTGTTANTYGFQGEEQDATGLYYLRARYMDPTSGTLTSMDTYAGSLSDPISLHKYLFANSNPVMYSDPSGHETTLIECVEVCAIVGLLAGESLYLIHCFVNDEQVTAGGVLLSSVVGALVAIAIFFVIYAVAKLIVFIIAYFSSDPGKAEEVKDLGFSTFKKLKNYLGSPGKGNQWHHIVEQSQIKKTGFLPEQINNVKNIVAVPSGKGSIHSSISAYYSSIQPFTGGLRVRDWLAGRSFDEQFAFGLNQLSKYGEIIETIEGWIFKPFGG